MISKLISQETFLQEIKNAVYQIDKEAQVILFGSRARNEAETESDWDILILTPQKVDLKVEQLFRHKLFYLELEHEQAISTFVYSISEWNTKHAITPLYKNIQKEGILI
jgi:predicted nucleotidyltransferase